MKKEPQKAKITGPEILDRPFIFEGIGGVGEFLSILRDLKRGEKHEKKENKKK